MIIIQLLKDTKYPANYQIIIDSSLGNYAVLRDFFSALHEGHGRPRSVRKSSRLRCKSFSMDCICSDRRKSFGPSAPIAYATSVSPPNEAIAWLGRRYWISNDAAGCPWQSSCKSPRTLQKCKSLITRQLTFGAVLGEHKLRPPRTPMCPRGA